LLGIQSDDSETVPNRLEPTEQPQLESGYPAQNGLAATEDLIYAIENGDILQINSANEDITARINAPTGERAGLAYGDGSIWFSDAIGDTYDGEIVELDPHSGDTRSTIATSYDAVALAFGEGSLWVCDITGNNVVEYSPDGNRLSVFDTRGPTGSTEARGLAYAGSSLYVGTRDTNDITEFDTEGTSQGKLEVPDRPYRGLAATSEVLLGPDENGEVTALYKFDKQE
jgi:streptogramin lyase